MANKSVKKKKPDDGADVLYLRIDKDLSAWLGELSRSTGRSRNQIAEGVLQEFRDVLRYAGRVEREGRSESFVQVVGANWASRLVSLGVVSEALRDSWRAWLEERQSGAVEGDHA